MSRLPDERDMDQVVRSWMREEDEHAADRNRQVGRIMGRIDETQQRRGAWRLFPFGHGGKRIDDDDEELFVTVTGGAVVRRGVSSAMGLAAVVALIVMGLAFVASLPEPMTGSGAQPSSSPMPTIHPDDVALRANFAGTWSGEDTSLSDVRAVYAEDAVHTAQWIDTVERLVGPFEIWTRIRESEPVGAAEWIRVLDAGTGEHRYLGVTDDLAGIACMLWVRDALITRHDCILPMSSTDGSLPMFVAPTGDTLAVWQSLHEDVTGGWTHADRDLIARTVSPEIVHHVAYDNADTTLEGLDAYMSVMGYGEPQELAAPVPLPAPAGEHRWTDFSGVAGGTLCTFWERDGLIVRHDCIAPTFTYVPPDERAS